tara:strand:+ start:297 stop:569 length:273 start_codon:yes stop_codon:yes gene_type:complete
MKFKILVVVLVLSLILNVFFIMQGEITGRTVQEINATSLNVYTIANCSEENESVSCYDEIYLACNDIETKLGNVIGEKVEFELDWEDPRE